MDDVLALQALNGARPDGDEAGEGLVSISVAGSTLSVVCDWDCVWGSAMRVSGQPAAVVV